MQHATQSNFEHEKKIKSSSTLPRIADQVFIGREKELKRIARMIDFLSSPTRIISITGSPGFGKSSLAIHTGYKAEVSGIAVYYTDLSEASDMKLVRVALRETVKWEDRQHLSLIHI